MNVPEIPLKQEMDVYRYLLPYLTEWEGKWIVIKETSAMGPFETFDDALTAGYDEFGLGPWLCKQVFQVEPVHHV